jgi:glycosyltransferase involved in cell wall biosynthesis
MRVLSFGIYSKRPEYPRQRNLLAALVAAGVEVDECHYPMAESFDERLAVLRGFGRIRWFVRLLASWSSLALGFLEAKDADVILVGHPGYFHVHLARGLRLFRHRRALLVHDVFFSLYEAVVEDRGLLRRGGAAASLLRAFEILSYRAAELLLVDTSTHADHLARQFRIPRERFQPVLPGPACPPSRAEEGREGPPEPFRVLYVGTFIPLHGVEVILGAARRLLPEQAIRFRLVGSGQLRQSMESLAREWRLENVRFDEWVETSRLGSLIRSHDLSLGIFGTTTKAARVIPFKVFDVCAAGGAFVTADTPAVREVFRHEENAYLVPAGDPDALARAIRILKEDGELRMEIARGAFELARTRFAPKAVGAELSAGFAARRSLRS